MTSVQGQAEASPSDTPHNFVSVHTVLPSHPMRRRANTSAAPEIHPSTSKFVAASIYSHVSTYRTSKIELQLYSPSLKVYSEDGRGPMAVFSEHDQVGGKVTLDATCGHTGKLSISVEGCFLYRPPTSLGDPTTTPPELVTHTFLESTTTITLSNSDSISRSVFRREGFVRRRPSVPGISTVASSTERTHPFSFALPTSSRIGEEMPATFAYSGDSSNPDYFEVIYKVVADWEPSDPSEMPSRLEVPFMLQPDVDFQCMDASGTTPDSWLEMPLKPDRPIPVRCAITLPTSVTFSRSSSIPYYVVFTTTPRSVDMAKEIAADATISVSLIREMVVAERPILLPPSPPLTPTSEESDSPLPLFGASGARMLRRVARSQPRLSRPRRPSEATINGIAREKPLPRVPVPKPFADTRTLHSNLCIGFPKRPRQMCDNKSHPSLETIASLPDGLHKTRIPLSKEMLPSIDWSGVSVKYYLDVTVCLGLDDFRSRIPVRIF